MQSVIHATQRGLPTNEPREKPEIQIETEQRARERRKKECEIIIKRHIGKHKKHTNKTDKIITGQ